MYDVLFIPEVIYNLFSVKYAGRKGIDFLMTDDGTKYFLKRENEIIATGCEYSNSFKLHMYVLEPKVCNLTGQISGSNQDEYNTLQTWHERLCHQNVRHVHNFSNNMNITFLSDDFFCEGCAYSKQHRLIFHDKIHRATEARDIIYTDVCGPMQVESLGRKLYFVVFKDDFSGYREIYFIRQKIRSN